ncbi:MAG: RNA-binding protein [Pseudomonadota bacterium]
MSPSRTTPNREPAHAPGDNSAIAPGGGAAIQDIDRGPPKASFKGPRDPERRCVATGARRRQSKMIRFVLDPDNQVTPDIAAKLPGRGAWVNANRSDLDLAVKQKAFSRAFKTQASTPDDLCDAVETRLAQRCLELIGMARGAGDVILGFDQAREEIRSARPGCLIEASDGAEDGRSKLVGLAKALYLDEEGAKDDIGGMPPIITCFSSRELGMALGRDRVIHGVVKQGRFAQTWTVEVARLSGFRATATDMSSPGTDR